MRHQGENLSERHVLLLSDSERWHDAVSEAARHVGARRCEVANSVEDAFFRVIAQPGRYSHVLVQPSSAGPRLHDLLRVTSDGAEWGVQLVSLGERLPFPPDITCVVEADRASVVQALTNRRGNNQAPLLDLGDLRQALADRRIENRYQPVVALRDARPVGLEVLARLRHPAHGTLMPDSFIPPIEEAGLSPELLAAVTARAFAELPRELMTRFGLTYAFNLPLDILVLPAGLEHMEVQRRRANMPAEKIVIELTESHPVTDLHQLGAAAERWRSAGYGLAIDDVGPLVNNYEDLFRLPFTIAKLDKLAVMQAARDDEARRFLDRAITLAHQAGMMVIAEGVEDWLAWAQMRRLGVDEAQGFLMSRPLPAAAVPLWMQAWTDDTGRWLPGGGPA